MDLVTLPRGLLGLGLLTVGASWGGGLLPRSLTHQLSGQAPKKETKSQGPERRVDSLDLELSCQPFPDPAVVSTTAKPGVGD